MGTAKTRILFCTAVAILLATHLAVAAIAPSEVLYNPAGTDNGLEFIELAGAGDLSGCVVRDTASEDILELLRAPDAGNDLALIVESDGVYGNLSTGAALYSAGAAIGNGLANTAETVTLTCAGDEVLTLSYNASLLDVPDGSSIVWHDSAWIAGVLGGTPGVPESIALNDTPPEPPGNASGNATGGNTTAPPSAQPPGDALAPRGNGGAGGMPPACNSTLLLTVGATEGYPEEVITFTIVSQEYASWEAMTDDGMLAYGDTLTSRTHAITLPHGVSDVRLIAESRACDGRQRTTRHLTVLPERQPEIARNASAAARAVPIAAEPAVPAAATAQPVPEARAADARPAPAATMPTGAVIIDEDRAVLPWIASFGIVTVLASAGVFLVVHRGERADRGGAAAGSDAGRGASDHDGSRAAHSGRSRTRPSGRSQGGRTVGSGVFVDGESRGAAEAKYISPPVAQADDDDDR